MQRKLGSTDFDEIHKTVFEARASGGWLKCDRHEFRGDEIVAAPDRVRGLNRGLTEADDEGWVFYDPINDVPDLFLRFAKLYDEPDFNTAILDFADKYGLPSGADERPASFAEVGFDTNAENWSLSQFRYEVRRAWVILALYEAALNDDDRAVRKLLAEHGDIESFSGCLSLLKMGPTEHQNFALAVGLRCAVDATEEVVHKYCRQRAMLSMDPNIKPSAHCEVDVFWTYDTLLGAMYLQMYWLMVSGGNVTRCEHCGRIVSLDRPHPNGRKRRSDKRFCNDACRQAQHRAKGNRA